MTHGGVPNLIVKDMCNIIFMKPKTVKLENRQLIDDLHMANDCKKSKILLGFVVFC